MNEYVHNMNGLCWWLTLDIHVEKDWEMCAGLDFSAYEICWPLLVPRNYCT